MSEYSGAQHQYESFVTGTRALSVFHGQPIPKWMWDGKYVSLEQMAHNIFGDDPEKTIFILKYSKGENNE